MICQAYLTEVEVSHSEIQPTYAKNLTAAVLEEQARLLAQGVHADPETVILSAQEQEPWKHWRVDIMRKNQVGWRRIKPTRLSLRKSPGMELRMRS
jgi:hypothetical protein